MKIVLIGGNGLVGTKVAERLRKAGHEVVAASRASGVDAVSGAERWRRSVPRQRVDAIAPESGPAVPTPVADASGVYSFFPEFGLVSYDYEGQERWRLELPPFKSYYGLASSPIIEQGVLILLCDQTIEPYILGVDPQAPRLGLGTTLTLAGLHHLHEAGIRRVMLYVDSANEAAIRLYTKLGFARWSTDTCYQRQDRD